MGALFSDLLPPIFYQKKVTRCPTSRPSEELRSADESSAFLAIRVETFSGTNWQQNEGSRIGIS